MRNVQLKVPIYFKKWLIVVPRRNERETMEFLDLLMRSSGHLGVKFDKPRIVCISNDYTENYLYALKENVDPDVDLAMCILSFPNQEKYNAIKQLISFECPIPNQIILSKNLRNPKKLRTITQKIIMQLPRKEEKNGMIGFVATTHPNAQSYYTNLYHHSNTEKDLNSIITQFTKGALDQYFKKNNNTPPSRIIVYRDGVGDSQMLSVLNDELPQIKKACKLCSENYNPQITIIIVQKRIKTRYFIGDQNPRPGTIIDNTITKPGRFDFFLVPQNVHQGTATPVHFQCIYDECKIPPDVLHQITYKLCHLYYNWSGTVRVPAVCQYAQKASFLGATSLKQEVHKNLHDKLYYL